ncbi:MAG: phosphate acyltransferase PlsX [Lentisphaerales bacterium]|jgi:glycerol-3-phosphate acyltransferase PlsX|nr:MAG: phosphate acyltransferase PlsX [Lentisphaerales bacterium]
MRVAVDAMGGDHAPREIVAGAVRAAAELTGVSKVLLVGDEAAIRDELNKHRRVSDKIEVKHASEVVGMGEAPAQAVRKKKDSSIGRAVDLVKKGEADAVVSAGNTGAVVVASSLKLRNLEGVGRPAIATVMPTLKNPFVLIDAGANIDCDARLLGQFAVMGAVYCREILGRANPVIGLLSIGGEDTKGNEVTKEAFRVLDASNLNFRGNIEGHDLFEGQMDVVVCDGFVGNIVLKTSESVALVIGRLIKSEFTANPLRMAGALLLRGATESLKTKMDPELHGGALLLGVNGVCIITHGGSSAKAIFHAIRVACESIHHQLNNLIVEELRRNGLQQ